MFFHGSKVSKNVVNFLHRTLLHIHEIFERQTFSFFFLFLLRIIKHLRVSVRKPTRLPKKFFFRIKYEKNRLRSEKRPRAHHKLWGFFLACLNGQKLP